MFELLRAGYSVALRFTYSGCWTIRLQVIIDDTIRDQGPIEGRDGVGKIEIDNEALWGQPPIRYFGQPVNGDNRSLSRSRLSPFRPGVFLFNSNCTPFNISNYKRGDRSFVNTTRLEKIIKLEFFVARKVVS